MQSLRMEVSKLKGELEQLDQREIEARGAALGLTPVQLTRLLRSRWQKRRHLRLYRQLLALAPVKRKPNEE